MDTQGDAGGSGDTVTVWHQHAAEWDGAHRIVTVETPGILEDVRRLSPGSRIGLLDFAALSGETAAMGLEVDRWQGAPACESLRPGRPDLIAFGRPAT